MNEVYSIAGQQLIDIAIQETGDASKLYDLAKLSNVLPSQIIATNTHLKTPEAARNKLFIVNKLRALKPSTGNIQLEQQSRSGINYWTIGVNFKVS